MATKLQWGPHPEMYSAERTERARTDGFEVLAYDVPPDPQSERPERMIGWEIFADPPRYTRQVARGTAATYDQAKADATAAHSALVAGEASRRIDVHQREVDGGDLRPPTTRVGGSGMQVVIDPEVLKELEYIVALHREHGAPNPMESVEQLVNHALATIADGSRRPGAWEREILEKMGLVAACDDHQRYRKHYGPATQTTG